MKRAAAIVLVLLLFLSVGACGERGVPAQNAPAPVGTPQSAATPAASPDETAQLVQTGPTAALTAFFEAFETGDYAAMKRYCTNDFVEDDFRSDGVYGMATAKLTQVGTEEFSHDQDDCDIQVTVALTPTTGSAFTGKTQATLFVELELEHGVWLIDGFDTEK